MTSPHVTILRAPGTNCNEETAFAFAQAGAVAEQVHVNQLLESPASLARSQILCIPGGFSYGDDVAAGRIFANQLRLHLADVLREFCEAGKLVIGICNGLQVLLKTGLLTGGDEAPRATLAWNDSGKFEDRWTHLRVLGDRCVFLSGIEQIELPIAHAEGKFVARDAETLSQLEAAGQLVLRYTSPTGEIATDKLAYPANPNGSHANVAGLCDATGRIFGLMPHPERFVDPAQHPRWTREPVRDVGDGSRIFLNAVRYFR